MRQARWKLDAVRAQATSGLAKPGEAFRAVLGAQGPVTVATRTVTYVALNRSEYEARLTILDVLSDDSHDIGHAADRS